MVPEGGILQFEAPCRADPTQGQRGARGAKAEHSIRRYVKGLGDTPHRGTSRNDLLAGSRIVRFKTRTAIAFEVDDALGVVTILRIFYSGQDYEGILGPPGD
jgi:plasmid stabilization system protein ParE